MKNLFSLCLIVLVTACSQNMKRENIPIASRQMEWSLKQQLLSGDTLAYIQLYNFYYQKDNAVDFFPWALIMANKYHYKRAFRDAYACLLEFNNYYGNRDINAITKSNLLDSATMNLAYEILSKNTDTALINEELRSTKRLYKTKDH